MSLTNDIKEFALDLGFSRVGITTADPFSEHIDTINSRQETYDFYIADSRRLLDAAAPRQFMPSAKSIISVVFDYTRCAFPENLLAYVGRIYLGRCYNAPVSRINGGRMKLMKDFLVAQGCQVGEGFILPERWAAARSGSASFGRNNFAYAGGVGSFIVLGSFAVDKELAYDEPDLKIKCPPDCTACLDACPSKAIYEPLKLNPRRCLAFNAWYTQDGKRPGITSYIDPEIREAMGARVHGCDICQEACPRNRKQLRRSQNSAPDAFLEKISADFNLSKLLNMSEEFYRTRVLPIMYNYISEKKYFQRNAAIAMGNSGDTAYIPDLLKALHDPEDLVRGYTAWALGRIGGSKAKAALEKAAFTETSPLALKELRQALEKS